MAGHRRAHEAVTFTVKVYRSEDVGVPDSSPVEAFSVRPGGRLPPDAA
jgi:hypothetical protein